ncbi:uncharacterized protein LOC118746232 [Rhagoletis pomonella]|uniref:uncharacterized protein LOC118746232 n=1 Tax=Rhagoletis pomonella TaxID=28610 RepID=UPI00177E22ED|nr:uncharacterized protein LOC118746232 [Rhagoletis pomonella]
MHRPLSSPRRSGGRTNKMSNNQLKTITKKQQKTTTGTSETRATVTVTTAPAGSNTQIGSYPKSTKRRGSFMECPSDTEAALFIEHASTDDDEPSTSEGFYHEKALPKSDRHHGSEHSCSQCSSENRHRSSRTTQSISGRRSTSRHHSGSPARHRSRSTSRRRRSPIRSGSSASCEAEWQTARRKHRRAKPSPLPSSGHPGAFHDQNRTGLAGSGAKWYLRYLEQGKTPDVARTLAGERVKEEDRAKKERAASVEEQTNDTKEPAPASKQRSGKNYSHHKPAPASKWKSGQITSPEHPTHKRQREHAPPPASWPRSQGGQSDQGQTQGVPLQGIRLAVLPRDFPAVALSSDELTDLQDAIMDAVSNGWSHPLVFCGVYFRFGLLLVDCKDERTAAWLAQVTPKLEGWKGPALCTKRGDEILPLHNVTVFLPRSADKSAEYALGLLKAQNEGLNTSAWRVISSSIENTGLRLHMGIDEESYCSIKRAGFNINYRYSFVTVRPWRPKSTGNKVEESQETQADAAPAPDTAIPF